MEGLKRAAGTTVSYAVFREQAPKGGYGAHVPALAGCDTPGETSGHRSLPGEPGSARRAFPKRGCRFGRVSRFPFRFLLFGWPVMRTYADLGKKRLGLLFLAVYRCWIINGLAYSALGASPVAGFSKTLALTTYLAAWIHMNGLLTSRQRRE